MAWGNILTQVASAANPALGAGVSFLNNLFQSNDEEKKAKQAENAYYAALAQQKQLAELSAQTASQRAAFEKAMKDRILLQTGELGSTLRAAQRSMGAMPQFKQDTINQDYATTKAGMMQNFNDMLTLVESQGRAAQIDRLGGAGSIAADNDRMNALIKRYSPELINIDNQAYEAAVGRATSSMGLINTNRKNTLDEITGVLNPQINAETNLLTGGGTDITNLMNSYASYQKEVGDLATSRASLNNARDEKVKASLGALLYETFNQNKSPRDTTRLSNGDTIYWNR